MPRTRFDPAVSRNTHLTDVDQRIARRVSEYRHEYRLSLEELAGRSGVSRAMISKIERAETSASAVVLTRLATGLGVSLPNLLGFTVAGPARPASPVSHRKDQARWRDPDTGYQRRTLTPPDISQPMKLSEISFPPQARVAFEAATDGAAACQQIWMLSGEMQVRIGDRHHRLVTGDCLALVLDQPVQLHNPGTSTARYLLAASRTR